MSYIWAAVEKEIVFDSTGQNGYNANNGSVYNVTAGYHVPVNYEPSAGPDNQWIVRIGFLSYESRQAFMAGAASGYTNYIGELGAWIIDIPPGQIAYPSSPPNNDTLYDIVDWISIARPAPFDQGTSPASPVKLPKTGSGT